MTPPIQPIGRVAFTSKLTAASGLQRYIIFTVRDDARSSDVLVQQSVNTWQAYNCWGGQSLYAWNSEGQVPAQKISFNRPYFINHGTGDFLGNQFGGSEMNMLRFLEREGYDVTYATDVDLHQQGVALLSSHKAFLCVGHDEYWSYQMRAAVQQARDQGKLLGFFGANCVYWQVRNANSVVSPQVANRTLVGYKEAAEQRDPYYLSGNPANYEYITTRFRDLPDPPYNVVDAVARPENNLMGVMFHGDQANADIVVSNASSWVYMGTGVVKGTAFVGMLGYEDDTLFDNQNTPAGLQVVAESPDPYGLSYMGTHVAASGAVIFATGSMQWNWGLDDYNVPQSKSSRLNIAAQQTTRNILARFAAGRVPSAPAGFLATPGPAQIALSWAGAVTATSYNVYRATSPGRGRESLQDRRHRHDVHGLDSGPQHLVLLSGERGERVRRKQQVDRGDRCPVAALAPDEPCRLGERTQRASHLACVCVIDRRGDERLSLDEQRHCVCESRIGDVDIIDGQPGQPSDDLLLCGACGECFRRRERRLERSVGDDALTTPLERRMKRSVAALVSGALLLLGSAYGQESDLSEAWWAAIGPDGTQRVNMRCGTNFLDPPRSSCERTCRWCLR